MTTIAVIRQTDKLTDQDVARYVEAQNIQLSRDFKPIWGIEATAVQVHPNMPLLAGEYVLYLRDHTGADDLGNHAATSGTPYGIIGAADCALDGSSWTVDASHEVLEMLVDPLVTTFTVAPDGWTYTKEVCDAVQDDSYGYKIGSVLMTGFVTPAWFVADGKPPFTFPVSRAPLTQPYQLGHGGYIQRIKPGGKSWETVTPLGERLSRRQLKDQNPSSRAGRRAA